MGTGTVKKIPVINPYVGPRPFTRDESTRFFGRDNESRDLLSLVVSEQMVLFYAQSGAGKSSLVNTRLVPGLEERNFEVLPIGRVSGEVLKSEECDNIFIFNLLTNIDQSKTAPERFARMRLGDFLANLFYNDQEFLYTDPSALAAATVESAAETLQILPRALIIDQFEELITTHPEAWEKRADFFKQLAEAMQQDPYLWVVLVMREDYVAAFDPFAHLLPNQLRARFYMRRMGYDAALEAVRKPVEKMRPFDTGIAETLVDNLRLVSGIPGQVGQGGPVYGEFIEPVQLQVVCYQLWSNLMKEVDTLAPGKRITQADIDTLAKGESLVQFINKALADFYEQAIAKVLQKLPGKVTVQELRNWFSTQLITEAETRGFVYQGKTHTAGLPNEAISVLASQYIIRPETRPGGTWFELVHDRFVGPILQSNRRWTVANQSRLLTDAKAWLEAGRPSLMLYEGKQLESAQVAIEKSDIVTDLEKEFVNLSAREFKRRRDIRIRLAFGLGTILLLALSGLTAWALSSRNLAEIERQAAFAAQETAVQSQQEALLAKQVAEQSQLNAEEAAQKALQSANIIQIQNATAQAVTTELVRKDTVQRESIARLNDQINSLISTSIASTPLPPPTLPTPTVILFLPTATAQTASSDATATPISPPETIPPAPTPTSTNAADLAYRQIVLGQSVKGKNILLYQFGNGPRHLVLVGGIHAGYAPSTVDIVKRLVDYFRKNPGDIPPSFTIDIIHNANPDSLTEVDLSSQVIGRLNGNKVDLNRNWDCYWRTDATWTSSKVPVSGGEAVFSEPETQALRDFIIKNLSVAVVVWEAREAASQIVEPGGCGEVSLFSQPLSDLYGKAAGYRSNQYIPYTITGSMTDWLDTQGIPAISVYLPSLTNVSSGDFSDQITAIRFILAEYGGAAAK